MEQKTSWPRHPPRSSAAKCYQAWQRELESEPVDLFDRRLPTLLETARTALADYVGSSADDLAFVPNATTGGNLAGRSLDLRVVYVSHVTSGTGLVLPVEEIVARARAQGLVTVVDGAHAPAQVPVNLAALGADFYSGNAHKWLSAPKGAGFLHVRPEHQERVDAAIVSWGYGEGNRFAQRIEKQGTRDPAAWLTVPDAIRFRAERDWDTVCDRCRRLTRAARRDLCDLVGTEPLGPESMLAQMATVRLPRQAPDLSARLFTRHQVKIPVAGTNRDLLCLSVAGYTTRGEIDRLLTALVRELDAEDGQQNE